MPHLLKCSWELWKPMKPGLPSTHPPFSCLGPAASTCVRHSPLFLRLCNFTMWSLSISRGCIPPLRCSIGAHCVSLHFFPGCQGDSCLSAFHNPSTWAWFLPETVRGGIFSLLHLNRLPRITSPSLCLPLLFLSAFRKPSTHNRAWLGMESVVAWAGAAPRKEKSRLSQLWVSIPMHQETLLKTQWPGTTLSFMIPFQRSYQIMYGDMVSHNNTRCSYIRLLWHRVAKEWKTNV